MSSDALELPLPAGMRDLLPDEAASREAAARAMLESFELFGYRVVRLPVFEFADVVERGLGATEHSDVLRFVEPESGEVAVLRPDMTPQVARIIATRMRGRPPPYRLAYEGSVVRRRSGRAKKHRQIAQVGVELAGAPARESELELLVVVARALRASGLERFTIDLSDAGIVRALVADADPTLAAQVTAALARKDEAELRDLTPRLAHGSALLELVRVQGGEDALAQTTSLLAGTPAADAAARLASLYRRATSAQIGATLSVDPAEVRGFAYYTGATFGIYTDGLGFSLGGGGRYDDLLARFGAPMSAAGLAVDLDALERALAHAGVSRAVDRRVVVVGPSDAPVLATLRERGVVAVASASLDVATEYARAWGYALVLDDRTVHEVARGASQVARDGEDGLACVLRVLKGTR